MTSTELVRLIAGGGLIGLAAALLISANGRVAGISGIASRALRGRIGVSGWRLAFLAGLCAPGIWHGWSSAPLPVAANWPVLLGSGLLVGVGTHLAAGCTSGHGVCGMANLSRRSLVATLLFMGAAIGVRFVG